MVAFKHFCIFTFATIYFADYNHGALFGDSSGMVTVNELSITSSVSIRYAKVLVRSLVQNSDIKDQEVSFQVRIPHEAFITSFDIVTNEKTIHANITEKMKAAEEYNKAKESNVNAGIVTQQTNIEDDIDRDIFNVNVNVAAESTLEFRLKYEELLIKNGGKYSQKIFVDSDHVIPSLEVLCEFKEKQKFKQLTYQTPLNGENLALNEEQLDEDGYYLRKILWKPSEADQEGMTTGLQKPFEIEYELEPPEDGGIVFINNNGEFVHMFSTPCEQAKIMMKQIVFVIDISGSMTGQPIQQVRQTMKNILTQLRSHDYFNIIIFNTNSYMWKASFQQATPDNIADATVYIESQVIATGNTNINDALLKAIRLFGSEYIPEENDRFGQMIFFLSDGEATVGVTNTGDILSNVRKSNYYEGEKCCKSTIYTIAFGKNADIKFLSALASEHEGTAKIIRDSSRENGEMLQLYHGIENPYYKALEFTFRVGDEIIPQENITRTQFRQYDCGNELVVGGWTYPDADISPVVTAEGNEDGVVFDNVPMVRAQNVDAETLSRLVVYEMVKQLLKEASATSQTDTARSEQASGKALALSLKYGFVTPLTSLVVTDFVQKTPKVKKENRPFSGTGLALSGQPQAKSGRFNAVSGMSLSNVQVSDDIQDEINDDLYMVDYYEARSAQDTPLNGARYRSYSAAIVLSLISKIILDL